jgi:tetratricopeptide (TPR) repeat protein
MRINLGLNRSTNKQQLFIIGLLNILIACSSPKKTDEKHNTVEASGSEISVLDSLNRLIADDSLNAEAYFERSRYYLMASDPNQALSDINKAIQIDDEDADYFVALADIYLATNRIPNCLEALLKAMDIDPANNDALLKLSEVYLILKDYENSFRYSGMALDQERINPVAYFIRGYAYMETGDTALAVKNFQAAADQKQDYYEAFMQLGVLYSIAKEPIAIGYFQTATRIAPNRPEAYYMMGMAYQEQESIPQAIETYNKLLAIAPDYKEGIYNLGYINLVYTGDYATAINYFTSAISLDAKYTDAYFNRGYCYELSGDYDNARKDYQKALELVPNYERSIEGLNRLDRL